MRWALSCTNHSEGVHGELVCVTWRSRREAFSRGMLRRSDVTLHVRDMTPHVRDVLKRVRDCGVTRVMQRVLIGCDFDTK